MFHNPPELGHCANLSGFHKPAIAAHHDGVADLIVVTGPPGSGKSTVAPLLSRMFTASAVVAGDDFFSFIDQGYLQPWTAEADQQNETVAEAAAAAAGRLSIGGYTVVYDGLLAPGFLERFRVATGLSSLHYAVLLPPEQHCVDRVRSRAGHGFTDLPATRQMYRDFAEADLAPNHLITSTADPAHLASTIFELVHAGVIVRAADAPPTALD